MARTLTAFVCAAVWAVAGAAQQPDTGRARPDALCYRPRPSPACSAFILTNGGAFVFVRGPIAGGTPVRGVLEWGLMRNVNAQGAVGGSVLVSLDEDGFVLGPAVRYRRWRSHAASFDFALAAPMIVIDAAWSTNAVRPGSIFGLMKWNPNHWVGLAVRPELVRYLAATSCPPGPAPPPCTYDHRYGMRMTIGLELGWTPGAVATGLSLVAAPLIHSFFRGLD
jgi:hypothetical protein